MRRAATSLIFLAIVGCGQSPEPYLQVFQEQHAARVEVTKILGEIRDEKSLAQAKETLFERFDRFAEISLRARNLPKPSDAVKRELEQQRFDMQRGITRFQDEIRRISKIPGGEEFFEELAKKGHKL